MGQLKKWLNRVGSFSIDGKKYGPGQTFLAYENQVAEIFRDTIDCLGPVGNKEVVKEEPVSTKKEKVSPDIIPAFTRRESSKKIQVQVPPKDRLVEIDVTENEESEDGELFYVEPREEAPGWFNVLNREDGTIVNFNAMRKGKAEELAEEMNHGESK